MNGECNATNVQGKNYNLHKLQGGGARAPVPHSWWRHCRPRMHRLATVHARGNQPTNDQRRHDTAYLNKRLFY